MGVQVVYYGVGGGVPVDFLLYGYGYKTVTIICSIASINKHFTVTIICMFSRPNFQILPPPPTKRKKYKIVTIIKRHENMHH